MSDSDIADLNGVNPQDTQDYKNPEDTMVAASKLSVEENDRKPFNDEGYFSTIYGVVKKIVVVGSIYLIGYMGWSVAWLIAPVILSVTRDEWRKSMEHKRNIAKTSALANEKDVILARIDDLPAWVYFPDVERCEWVNKIFKQVWPNANHYARDLIKNSIEPSVAKALSGYKLNGFKFDRIILGTIPPRIGGVKIYDKNVSRNEIIMDLDLFYASDCDINFWLGGLKGGIKDFQIHGMVRVIMKPLITSMPLVGGLQVFFLNNPNVDFNLVGVIDLLDMPGLSDILRRVIVEQIASFMVLPNKLPITLNDKVPAFALKMPEPEGVLRIHVIEAKNLMKKDISVLGKGKSDPYAVVTVGAQEFKTKVVDNSVNPKWDYWCEAAILAESGQTLSIELYDKDDTSNDENLGRATVEIIHVVKTGTLDTWLTLEGAKHGMVHVRLAWLQLSSNPEDLQAALQETQMLRVTSMSTALLTVFIDSAKNLPQARAQSQPDPYLVLSLGNQTEQTAVQMRTNGPVWEQGFTFLVSNPDNDVLHFKVFDHKTGSEIGKYNYILSVLLTKKNLEIVSQPYQLQKSGPESKILMSMALKILKTSKIVSDDTLSISSMQFSEKDNLSRPNSVNESDLTLSSTKDTDSINEAPFAAKSFSSAESTPSKIARINETNDSVLIHRTPDITSSAGDAGLGRIQLTLRYTIQRQKLTVIVHKIMNIPLNDPSHIPDPYVKLYLLPSRSKESKRKTHFIKDNCNPVYDATFEYLISAAEMMTSELEVTVCSQKGFLYGGSPVIGMLKIPLNSLEISSNQGLTSWYDLLPENKSE